MRQALRLALLLQSVFCLGCFPAWRTTDEPRAIVTFVDPQTGREIEEILVLTVQERYTGLVGPDGGLNPGAFVLAFADVHRPGQSLGQHFSAFNLVPVTFFIFPAAIGTRVEQDGHFVLRPGYEPCVVEGGVFFDDREEPIRLELKPSPNGADVSEMVQKVLKQSAIHREYDPEFQVLWNLRSLAASEKPKVTVSLSRDDRVMIRGVLDRWAVRNQR